MTFFQFHRRLSKVQAEVHSEESSSREKYQFFPTTAFRVCGTLHPDGLAASSDDFRAYFPYSSACILFASDIWTW